MKQVPQVVIARKPGRGSGSSYPSRLNYTRLDVTSGSGNKLGSAKVSSVSPLYVGPVVDCDGESCVRFENAWQYRKIFPQLGHWNEQESKPTQEWQRWQSRGYKELKKGKGVRTPTEVSKLKKRWREARDVDPDSGSGVRSAIGHNASSSGR